MSRTDVQSVYIARGEVSGLLKIGRTRRLAERLRAVATQHQEPVATIAVIVAGGMLENELHRRFRRSRVAGRGREWFRDDGAIRAFVATLPAHQHVIHAETPRVRGAKPRRFLAVRAVLS